MAYVSASVGQISRKFQRPALQLPGPVPVRGFRPAALPHRESLRDIEACLRAQPEKLYHMGIRGNVSRSAPADANESRDWRIYFEFAQTLVRLARELYAGQSLGIELKETVYALDSMPIDLCLSMFEWASFHQTNAAVKLHTLLDLRGSIPTFIHIGDGKLHDVNVLDLLEPELGDFYVMDRGYVDFKRLHKFVLAGSFFVTRAKSNFKYRKIKANPVDRNIGVLSDQVVEMAGFHSRQHYPEQLRRFRYRDQERRLLIFLTNNMTLPATTICDLYRLR